MAADHVLHNFDHPYALILEPLEYDWFIGGKPPWSALPRFWVKKSSAKQNNALFKVLDQHAPTRFCP
jgi:hypothetical protein